MGAYSETIEFETAGEIQLLNITDRLARAVANSGIRDGIACVFTTSSTSAIITNEYEPGLVEEDIPGTLERLFPRGIRYGHEERWHDGNGHSHVRAAFLGPSLSVPIAGGRPVLGTWQQVCFVEMDNKPRQRRVLVQVVGE